MYIILVELSVLILSTASIVLSITTFNFFLAAICSAVFFVAFAKFTYRLFGTKGDAWLDISELVERRGYKFEEHNVQTDDGYIIKLFRLRNPHFASTGLKPILLAHGLGANSSHWIVNSVSGKAADWTKVDKGTQEPKFDDSLAFSLSNHGFDVWLGNMRGSNYCMEHSTLSAASDPKYWDFTFDEMAKFDVPAILAHIKKTTNSAQIDYIGLSQGAIMLIAAMAECPALAASVDNFIAVACPIRLISTNLYLPRFVERAILTRIKPLLIKHPGPLLPLWFGDTMSYFFGNHWFADAPKGTASWSVRRFLLKQTWFIGANYNASRSNVMVTFARPQNSRKNAAHLIQMRYTSEFGKLDLGEQLNLVKYGTKVAPLYDLSRIDHEKITIMYSEGDRLVLPKDVHYLRSQLKCVKQVVEVEKKNWDHFDYHLGYKSHQYVSKPIINLLTG